MLRLNSGTIPNCAENLSWPPNSAIIFDLDQHEIRRSKTIIRKTPKCRLTIDVGTAERFLHIERNDITVTGVRDCQTVVNGKNIFRSVKRMKGMFAINSKPSKREVSTVCTFPISRLSQTYWCCWEFAAKCRLLCTSTN